MAGVLALLKALLPFLKEMYTGDENLKPAQRRQRIIVFSVLITLVFLMYLGNMYIDHTKVVRSSDLEVLTAKIASLEEDRKWLEMRLVEQRNHLARVELALDRSMEELRRAREELNSLRACIWELHNTLSIDGHITHEKLMLCTTIGYPSSAANTAVISREPARAESAGKSE